MAFSWTPAGGRVDLPTLGGHAHLANAVNNLGQVVGHSDVTIFGPRQAFLWTAAGGMVNLGATLGATRSGANASLQ